MFNRLIYYAELIPYSIIALFARMSMAATFWLSGQTKIEGFAFNPILGKYQYDRFSLNDTVIYLFSNEYKLPFIDPIFAAWLTAISEHLFSILLFFGLATRFSAFALLIMTSIIQIFVYPDAYATHFAWIALFLMLLKQGGGKVAIDYLLKAK